MRQAKGDGSRGSLRAPLEMESLIADYVYRPKFKCKMTVNNPSIQYIIQLNFTLKTTTAQVVETLVTVNNNISIQECVHPDDHTQPIYETFNY